jgi:gliding motility-associated-like protein
MKRTLLIISITASLFFFFATANAQTDTVANGGATKAINFPETGCTYTWVNNTPAIGLPASGTGNIASFNAVNMGSSTVTATIIATPQGSGSAYITEYYSGTVLVINTTTNKVKATIKVGNEPCGISVSRDGTKVYVTNYADNTVSVIDVITNTVVATIPVGTSPYGVAVSPDGSRIYVTNLASGTVSVINTATYKLIAFIPGLSTPSGIAVSPDGKLVYVANEATGNITAIKASTNTVAATIGVYNNPFGIAFSPYGGQAYVVAESEVSVINTPGNTVTSLIHVGNYPRGLAISPDGSRVYVANTSDNNVSVINTATGGVVALVPVGSNPYGLSVTPDGTEVFVTNYVDGTVSVINTSTNMVSATINVGGSPLSFGNFITNGPGCSLPLTFTITVNPTPVTPIPPATGNIVIPNTFTPNNDGINDTWDIKYLNSYPNCTVNIFDRYGQEVYSSIGYGIPWDGRRKGANLPQGTYYYIIKLQINQKALAGSVTIIR